MEIKILIRYLIVLKLKSFLHFTLFLFYRVQEVKKKMINYKM